MNRRFYILSIAVLAAIAAVPAEARPKRHAAARRPVAKAPAAAVSDGAPKSAGTDAVRMPSTSIEGERQAPDIFFVVPTGRGGKLSAPYRRDYSAEIREPVVKSWLEKDASVHLATVSAGGRSFDWNRAMAEAPRPASGPIAVPARGSGPPSDVSRPAGVPPALPAAALSAPPPMAAAPAPGHFASASPPSSAVPPSGGGSAYAAPSAGPAPASIQRPSVNVGPSPSDGGTSDGVPILVPPQ